MEFKNKFLGTAVALFICILTAMVLVIGVSYAIKIVLTPVISTMTSVGHSAATATAEVQQLSSRVATLEADIRVLKRQPRQAAQRPEPQSEDYNKVYQIPLGSSYILGNPNAKTTIVEFSDFQCPFCARFHPMLNDVHKAFPDDVRIIVKNFPLPFHPNARPAAKAALAAGIQGKYFEMVELLLANGGDASADKLKEYAGKIGLNADKLAADLKEKDAEFEKLIAADMDLASQVDVAGTPTYFLNGKKTMARDIASWTAEIKALIKK